MPVQQQMSSFAQRLGGRVAQANAEHHDKPVDTGNRRLPSGIRSGVAKLSTMYTKQQTEDNSKTPKGETFFRTSAIVLCPESYNGEKVAGMVTQQIIPLCDVPAKGQRKAQSFSDNWYEFQNMFKLLGINPPNETQQTDPTGQRTEAYYFAAMKTLTDPKNPVYIEFSTRGWTPPPTSQQPKPEEMVFETWHGLASSEAVARINAQQHPAAGVQENGAPPTTTPPFNEFEPPLETQTSAQHGAAPPPTAGSSPQYQPGGDSDPTDVVEALVETAMADPEGKTEDGATAGVELEKLALAAGWALEQIQAAPDWATVGDMVLNPPETKAPATTPTAQTTQKVAENIPAVGSKWKFAKRTKDGARLKDNKGKEFPPQEVEVVTVDTAAKTCTVKTSKDGKDVVDIRSKKPVAVKWEWLEL